MFICQSCGAENNNDKAKFCNECGTSKETLSSGMDLPEQINRYKSFIEEIFFSSDSQKVDEISRSAREKLKISITAHRKITDQLSLYKEEIRHFFQFKFEFDQNVQDAFAGHDTYLKFRFTNLSDDEFFKVNLVWDDPEKPDEMDLKIQGTTLIHPHTSLELGGTHVFPRGGVKNIGGLLITVFDQIGGHATFKAAPFSFKVQNLELRSIKNITNQISIEGRVVDASGMGIGTHQPELEQITEVKWIPLTFSLIKPNAEFYSERSASITFSNNNQLAVKGNKNEIISEKSSIVSFDNSIVDIVASAFNQVGMEGVIYVAESKYLKYGIDVIDCMHIDSGYISPIFINNFSEKATYFDDPNILLLNRKLASGTDLNPLKELFDQVIESQCPLVILAEEITGTALEVLESKAGRGIFKMVAINSPNSAMQRKKIIEDIAVLTGGVVVEYPDEKFDLHCLGRAKRVEVTDRSTKIIDGSGTYSAIVDRVNSIRVEIEVARTESEQEFHRERIAKLAGGIAHIKIFASSEAELTEKKATLKNCLTMTRNAIKNGEIKTEDELKLYIKKSIFEIKS